MPEFIKAAKKEDQKVKEGLICEHELINNQE